MSQKTYLAILKSGIYISFFIFFFVFSNLLFPFITSKQIPFNILVEFLLVFWIGLIVKYPSYRPARSQLTYGLIAFFATVVVTCFTGVDFNLSFWGDIERMLGAFHLLHFLAFYLIIITVMRDWKDWQKLFSISVVTSVIIAIYSMTGPATYSTLGNTSYVSGLMIFNIYFSLILAFRTSNRFLKATYLAAIPFLFGGMVMAATRGAYIGLGASILLFFGLVVLFVKNKKLRIASLVATILFIIGISLVFTNKQSNIVQNSRFLRRLTDISLSAGSFQTRLISWKAAWLDFPNHPFLGTGYGNYAISFDKFFDPVFYNYSKGDTYFDHAHNNIVDIASTTGLIGLAAYLSIFVATFYYLFRGRKNGQIGWLEFSFLVCLIVAYFIQNIVLFDSFVTYVSLMVMLGFIYWLVSEPKKNEVDQPSTNNESTALIAAGLILLVIFFQYNYRVLQMLNGTIAGQIALARGGGLPSAITEYKKALSYDTPLDRDSRGSLGQLLLGQANALYSMPAQDANAIVEYVVGELKKNVALNPGDSFMQMNLAQALNLAASINVKDQSKFAFYSNQALEAIDKSLAATPGRVPVYFIKAQIQLTRGEKDKAIETLQYSISLNPIYSDGYCQLAKVYLYYQDQAKGLEKMNGCIDYGGLDQIQNTTQLKELAKYYEAKKDWPRAIKLYERLTQVEAAEPRNWAALANAYLAGGQKEQAIAAAKKAGEVDPKFLPGAEDFIKKINNSN
jgi:O-antigen ligase